jgi:hypothetical protein
VAHGPGSPSAQLDALPVGSKAVAAFIMPCLDCGFCSTGQEEMCDKFFAFNRGRGVLYDGTTRLYTADAGSTLTLTQECEPKDLSISSWSKFSMYVDNEKVRLYQREVCTRRTQARPWRVLTLLRRVLNPTQALVNPTQARPWRCTPWAGWRSSASPRRRRWRRCCPTCRSRRAPRWAARSSRRTVHVNPAPACVNPAQACVNPTQACVNRTQALCTTPRHSNRARRWSSWALVASVRAQPPPATASGRSLVRSGWWVCPHAQPGTPPVWGAVSCCETISSSSVN